jgi:hypothetical protein
MAISSHALKRAHHSRSSSVVRSLASPAKIAALRKKSAR